MFVVYNGASGGIGRHLAGALSERGHISYALQSRLEDLGGLDAELAGLGPRPDMAFIHLAALVSVPECERNPKLAHRVNVELAAQTLERVLGWSGPKIRVLYVSTGHVYASPTLGQRIAETSPVSPRSVYATTKLEAERMFRATCLARGVALTVGRVFGLIGPSQPAHYLLPALIDRVAANRLESIPGLDFVRDYLDARDVVRCLVALLSAQRPASSDVLNVCSGEPTAVRDLLREVLRAVDPSSADVRAAAATPAPGRNDDVPWLVGNPAEFTRLTGYLPAQIPRWRTVADAIATHLPRTEVARTRV